LENARNYRFLIAAMCVAYLAVRLWRLTDSCLWFDEIFSVHAAEHSWGGLWWFVAQDLVHPPLFYALLKIWIGIGGESLLWMRLFPVFFATLALFPFLHFCREIKIGRTATAVALFLLAVNGSLIKYSQEVRMYSVLLCLSLFSIWLFARFFYRGKNIWILTAVNILLVYTHYFGWLVVANEVLIILIMQRIKLRHMLTMSGILIAAYIPWLVAIWRAANGGSDIGQNIGWIGRPGFRETLDLILDLVEPFYFQISSADPRTFWWVSLPMIVVFIIVQAVYLSGKRGADRERIVLLAIFIGLPATVALLLSWLLPHSVWGPRHLIVIFAPVAILFGSYLSEIRSNILQRSLFVVLGVVSIAAFIRTVANPPQNQIWCAWAKATEVEVDRKDGAIYAFEDLAAYHLWFATRLPNTGITKVNGIEGIVEDRAYFLPRGSDDAVRIINAGDVPEAADMLGEKIHFAFRDSVWNEHHQPIAFFKQKGYKVRQVFASEPARGMRVFLGEASR
jgi:mannosyltransferase